ncbi:MAG: hypothetical protein ACTHMC_01515 [Pseudobacter sp.]|uniref:hypothetical protein n=1 Tax=Pseudobacter sp. TaxID=2045420 RepID=UPI003F821DA6
MNSFCCSNIGTSAGLPACSYVQPEKYLSLAVDKETGSYTVVNLTGDDVTEHFDVINHNGVYEIMPKRVLSVKEWKRIYKGVK